MSNPVGPSTATQKRLFALSSNRCAFPGCTSPLVDGQKVVGRICHIKARNELGKRYDPDQSAEERHSFSNLILLCGRHHDVVDDDDSTYTVEYLKELKAEHERAAITLPTDEVERAVYFLQSDQSVSSTNQSGGMTASTIHVHNYFGQKDESTTTQSSSTSTYPTVREKEGSARFRATHEPLGISWNLHPFATDDEHEIYLAKGPAIWLRLFPNGTVTREWSLRELLECGKGPAMPLQPLLWSDFGYLRAEDGVGAYYKAGDSTRNETTSVAFAFVTAELWCVDTSILTLDSKRNLYFLDIARKLVEKLSSYGRFLQCLGVQPPFNWAAGIEGVKGWTLQIPTQPNHINVFPGEKCLTNIIAATGTYDFEQPAGIPLQPFFKQLFLKCGLTVPKHIEEYLRTNTGY